MGQLWVYDKFRNVSGRCFHLGLKEMIRQFGKKYDITLRALKNALQDICLEKTSTTNVFFWRPSLSDIQRRPSHLISELQSLHMIKIRNGDKSRSQNALHCKANLIVNLKARSNSRSRSIRVKVQN